MRAGSEYPLQSLTGESSGMQHVRAMIEKLARSQAPIYISGESGSGKELAARLIHTRSARAGAPFVPVNCGAIPENLMESEFFGYRKGAFTGAESDRDGFFQTASGGTLFLDEVADLPLPMQVKLLRAIQEKRVRKVGAATEEPVDVRIICATHRSLRDGVEKGSFRQDLYYRLNVIELHMPPLRERVEDIPPLVDSLLGKLCGDTVPRISAGAPCRRWPAIRFRAMFANWRMCLSGRRRFARATRSKPATCNWRPMTQVARRQGGAARPSMTTSTASSVRQSWRPCRKLKATGRRRRACSA
jgi:transcriptional regulator with PAS, ATPase and Fis domain